MVAGSDIASDAAGAGAGVCARASAAAHAMTSAAKKTTRNRIDLETSTGFCAPTETGYGAGRPLGPEVRAVAKP